MKAQTSHFGRFSRKEVRTSVALRSFSVYVARIEKLKHPAKGVQKVQYHRPLPSAGITQIRFQGSAFSRLSAFSAPPVGLSVCRTYNTAVKHACKDHPAKLALAYPYGINQGLSNGLRFSCPRPGLCRTSTLCFQSTLISCLMKITYDTAKHTSVAARRPVTSGHIRSSACRNGSAPGIAPSSCSRKTGPRVRK